MNHIKTITISINEFEELVRKIIKEEVSKIKPKRRQDKMLSLEEAAMFLTVSLPTIHKYKKDGTIPSIRLGGRVFIKRSDLLNLK